MGKKNYTKYSEQSENTVEEIIDTIVDEVVEEVVEEVVNEVVEEVVDTKEDNFKDAIVTGCVKLNVRKEPSKDAGIVCVLEEFTEVTVDMTVNYVDFHKISTSVNGVLIEGYCMKKFINIK